MPQFLILQLLAVFGLGFASPCFAEIAPEGYLHLARNASEIVEIKVLRIDEFQEASQAELLVSAEVQSVRKSAHKLSPGSTIRLRYRIEQPPSGLVGPSEAPRLQAGYIYPAFLNASEVSKIEGQPIFQLAARGKSFSSWLWDNTAPTDVHIGVPAPKHMNAIKEKFEDKYPLSVKTEAAECHSNKSADQIEAVWSSSLELRVSVSRITLPGIVFAEGSGRILVKDGQITLIHYYKRYEVADQGDVPKCQFVTRLNFEAIGLSQRRYGKWPVYIVAVPLD